MKGYWYNQHDKESINKGVVTITYGYYKLYKIDKWYYIPSLDIETVTKVI